MAYKRLKDKKTSVETNRKRESTPKLVDIEHDISSTWQQTQGIFQILAL